MELAAQLEERDAELRLVWAPRTHNQEADDLSNNLTTGFRPENQIDVKHMAELPWLVLPEFMAEGQRFFAEIQETKRKRKEEGTQKQKEPRRNKEGKLRHREPW